MNGMNVSSSRPPEAVLDQLAAAHGDMPPQLKKAATWAKIALTGVSSGWPRPPPFPEQDLIPNVSRAGTAFKKVITFCCASRLQPHQGCSCLYPPCPPSPAGIRRAPGGGCLVPAQMYASRSEVADWSQRCVCTPSARGCSFAAGEAGHPLPTLAGVLSSPPSPHAGTPAPPRAHLRVG